MISIRYSDIIPFYIKLNANCPADEKSGSGPGSCGGKTEEKSIFKSTATITERMLPNGKKYYTILDSNGKVHIGNEDKSKIDREFKKLIEKEEQRNTSKSDKKITVPNNSVQSASNIVKYSDKLLSDINEAQLSAINRYTEESTEINGFIYTGKIREESTFNNKDEVKKIIDEVDSVFEKAKLPESIIVYRGITNDELIRISSQLKVGAELSRPTFTSTSYDKNEAEKFAQGKKSAILQINLPKGTKALALENHAALDNKSEKEILLARNTKFQVKKINNINGRAHIVLDVLL